MQHIFRDIKISLELANKSLAAQFCFKFKTFEIKKAFCGKVVYTILNKEISLSYTLTLISDNCSKLVIKEGNSLLEIISNFSSPSITWLKTL
ncbi:hypothetical protein BpHYR1_017016 [Brachionus plicatilis]|uniref:Uncharacterized protein n=1 Tax=Brachionus plicatilis TaxID=10195 RepID=A0A3M7PYP3_BRAPC|nr:hypothetical protein BpHYR1_017016 [Brachionus plicatilis]